MELQEVITLANARYLISNMKSDKSSILHAKLLQTFSVNPLGMSNNEKIYYDTPDFFFADKGVNIYTITTGNTTKDLVVRYDSAQVTRIDFLKHMPNYFKILMTTKDDTIYKHTEEIQDAIYRIFPTGLDVNIEQMIKAITPRIKILKKSDNYRVVNNTGLKMTMSFDQNEYLTADKKHKFSQPTLELVCETAKNAEDFNSFLRSIIIDFPKLIKMESNELTLSRKNLQ